MWSSRSLPQVVILAGGKGRRLAPYTFSIPKPIVPIGSTPILEIVLRQLAHQGFQRVTLALGHLSEIIRAFADDGSRFGLSVDYTDEPEPLGTIGPLHLIPDLAGRFIVMNADILTDLDFRDLVAHHQSAGAAATIATVIKRTQLGLGVISADAEGHIEGFVEKPTLEHRVSMGVYVFEREVLDLVPKGVPFGFDDLMLALIDAKRKAIAFDFHGRWLDMGVPEDYERAQQEFEANRGIYLPA